MRCGYYWTVEEFYPLRSLCFMGMEVGNVTFEVLKLGLEVVEIKVLRVKRWGVGMKIVLSEGKILGFWTLFFCL